MSVTERRAAAKSHLESIGMQRHGWLHPDLQVALHTAHKKGKITNEHLTALGNLLKRTTAERMRPHLIKASEIAKRASGQEALDYLVRTAVEGVKPPLGKKRLVIKHEDLHPEVKQKVQELLEARQKRSALTPLSAGASMQIGLILGLNLPLTSPLPSVLKGGVLGCLFPAGVLVGEYKLGSPLVRKATEGVAEKGKAVEFLDAKKTVSVSRARETHPFLVVDRKGNVHLIPKTKYQSALAKAQRTFLKHVVPGRYRAQL